jgi:hypothetical protein
MARLRPIRVDGRFGPVTLSAVKQFQKRHELPATGSIDASTSGALLAQHQEYKEQRAARVRSFMTSREPNKKYYQGLETDFELAPEPGSTPEPEIIHNVKITVYYPFIVKSRAQRLMEGPTHDRFGQTICTLEKFLDGRCPYVSVAIDRELRVPNGTPLLIPEIDTLLRTRYVKLRSEALPRMPIKFRIVDTGSRRFFNFKKERHIDIATDSDGCSEPGSLLSEQWLDLILPKGLRPRGKG